MTAAHVVRREQFPRVYLFSQQFESLTAEVLDKEEDDNKGLALLLLKTNEQSASKLAALKMGNTTDLGNGESVKIIGFPGGTHLWTVDNGNVKRLEGRNLVLSGEIRGGNSGGPIILNQQAIGLVTDVSQPDAYAGRAEGIVTYVNGIVRNLITMEPSSPPIQTITSNSSPSPSPPVAGSIPTYGRTGTKLVGISGTGATGEIRITAVHKSGSPSLMLLVDIENTSRSATITNIAFFIKCVNKPKWGSKVESRPGEIMKPGIYTFTTNNMEIPTRDFKVISAFGFMTGSENWVSTNFLKGSVPAGIAPGGSLRFTISGDGFLEGVTIPQLERGTILRFQGSDMDDVNDIAMFANLAVLFSPSDPIYQIYKTR